MLHLATNKLIETSGPSWPVFFNVGKCIDAETWENIFIISFLKRYPAAGFAKYVYCSTPIPPPTRNTFPSQPNPFLFLYQPPNQARPLLQYLCAKTGSLYM